MIPSLTIIYLGWCYPRRRLILSSITFHDYEAFFFLLAASEHSLVLKEINVPLWSHDTCNGALQAQFGPAYHLPDTAVCAGAEGRDACDVSLLFYTQSLSPKSTVYSIQPQEVKPVPSLNRKVLKDLCFKRYAKGLEFKVWKLFKPTYTGAYVWKFKHK